MPRFILPLAAMLFATIAFGFAQAADDYALGPDSTRQEGVPKGTVTQHQWKSQVFPDTERDYWVYVPAQYTTDAASLRDGLSGRQQLRR